MSSTDPIRAEQVALWFRSKCEEKNCQVVKSDKEYHIRLDVATHNSKANIDIYFTGAINIGGKKSALKDDLVRLKTDFENSSGAIYSSSEPKPFAVRYVIIEAKLQELLKQKILTLGHIVTTQEKPDDIKLYVARIKTDYEKVTVTQFENGTLQLQGKKNGLMDEVSTLVESTVNPTEQEVASRFICDDEAVLSNFLVSSTPDLINRATNEVESKLGDAFDYLEEHDRKYFVAAECLLLAKVLLPEFSAIVMPASKGFEGFTKKLGLDIGLFPPDHFKQKGANMSALNNKQDSRRTEVCEKDKYVETHLDKLSNDLAMTRHFMMHSDESTVTKVDSLQEAIDKVGEITKNTRELHQYFSEHWPL